MRLIAFAFIVLMVYTITTYILVTFSEVIIHAMDSLVHYK